MVCAWQQIKKFWLCKLFLIIIWKKLFFWAVEHAFAVEVLAPKNSTWWIEGQYSEYSKISAKASENCGKSQNQNVEYVVYWLHICIVYAINNHKHKYLIENTHMLWLYWKTILLSYWKFCSQLISCLSSNAQHLSQLMERMGGYVNECRHE